MSDETELGARLKVVALPEPAPRVMGAGAIRDVVVWLSEEAKRAGLTEAALLLGAVEISLDDMLESGTERRDAADGPPAREAAGRPSNVVRLWRDEDDKAPT